LTGAEPQHLKRSLQLALASGVEKWPTLEPVPALRGALRLAPRRRTVLKPPGEPAVQIAAYTPSEDVLAIAVRKGRTGEVRVLNRNGKVIQTLPIPTSPSTLRFHQTGTILGVGLRQGWDRKSGIGGRQISLRLCRTRIRERDRLGFCHTANHRR